jgi:hypothetical protein
MTEVAEALRLEYVPLTQVRRWDRNPKPHDLGALVESFRRYGFKDPLKYEPELNGGDGGIVEGNGRTEALLAMETAGEEPPRGIALGEDGAWAVPVLMGVDAASQAEAEAYGLDHNSLTVLGGTFGPNWPLHLYNLDELTTVLHGLGSAELPVPIDGDYLDGLLALSQDYLDDDGFFDATKLVGSIDAGEQQEAYIVFLSFEERGEFDEAIRLLTAGKRNADGGGGQGLGIRRVVLNGGEWLGRWREGLGS